MPRPASESNAASTDAAVGAGRRLPPLLRRAWYGLNQAFRRRIAHLEITPDQYTVLRNLSESSRRGVTQTELTRLMASDPNTIASLVERMEASGLLSRTPDARDRRARRLRITTEGRHRFRIAKALAIELQAEILAPLGETERDHFLELLETVGDACSEAAAGPVLRVARPGSSQDSA